MRKLFHGSEYRIEQPQFGAGNVRNDYGRGFYCTEHRAMANEWAVGRSHDGFANEYVLDDAGLVTVDLGDAAFCTLHWMAVLLENRTFDLRTPLAVDAYAYLTERFHVDLTCADVVEGYRADDSYFAFAQDFLSGGISYAQLQQAMKLSKLGRQVVLKSRQAFERLEFVEAHQVTRQEWLPKRESRDAKARQAYLQGLRGKREKGGLYIATILDEEMGPDDERLR